MSPVPPQVFHLASVRLRDLCSKLDISSELRRKIWTCFEFSLVHCPDMMKDRHLDQLLMCSVYIMTKVMSTPAETHSTCVRLIRTQLGSIRTSQSCRAADVPHGSFLLNYCVSVR